MAVVSAVDFRQLRLWDKVVNVDLISSDGSVDSIRTPDPSPSRGRKPTIRLRGSLKPSNLLLAVELRVTNLYLSKPLSSYKRVRATAGYASSLQVGFSGTVKVAYQELPGPDGVTYFQLLLGDLDSWSTAVFSGMIRAGTKLSDALGRVAAALGLTLIDSFPDEVLPIDVQFTGLAKDVLPRLEKLFDRYDGSGNAVGLRLVPYNDALLAYKADVGSSSDVVWKLDYVTLAKHTSYGYEVQAPWVPGIKPGSQITIDPRYFRESFGGAQVSSGNLFRVLLEEFDFCTTDSTNYMSLVAVTV